jgi:outer membrane protein OmpA-like peptidoglycan-associated protein
VAADARGDHILRLKLVSDYSRNPLTLLAANQTTYRVVQEQLWFHAVGSYALNHRFLFTLDIPVLATQRGEEPPPLATAMASPQSGPLLGDVRLNGRVRLLGPTQKGPKLAASADAWLPVGSASSYGSDGAFRGQALATLGEHAERLSWAINLGLLLRPVQKLPSLLPLRVGKTLTAGALASVAVDSAAHLHVGPELRAETAFADSARPFDPRSSALELLATLSWRVAGGPITTAVSAGPSIGQAPGSADYRAVLALSWSPEAPAPLPDRDDDTVADQVDACANLPGSPSNDPLMNGCPEIPPDFDGDAIADANDACPKVPGIPTAARQSHGCPQSIASDQEPPPAAPQAKLVEQQITISEQVLFETGTANIEPTSDAILREVATVLSQHTEIATLEVQGHTDNVGSEEFNRALSLQRAQAVVDWLIRAGVAQARLRAQGYGTSRPLASNDSEQGRSQNRRVEFRVLRAQGTGGAP